MDFYRLERIYERELPWNLYGCDWWWTPRPLVWAWRRLFRYYLAEVPWKFSWKCTDDSRGVGGEGKVWFFWRFLMHGPFVARDPLLPGRVLDGVLDLIWSNGAYAYERVLEVRADLKKRNSIGMPRTSVNIRRSRNDIRLRRGLHIFQSNPTACRSVLQGAYMSRGFLCQEHMEAALIRS